MNAGIKFVVAFVVALVVMIFAFVTYVPTEMNENFVLAIILIAILFGFFAVLHHKKMVHGNNWVFVVGLLMFLASGILLFGAVTFKGKEVQYWQISSQLFTYLFILLFAGFLFMVAGIRQIIKFFGFRK